MSIELIRGELERLFSLEEMMALSSDLLGFEPGMVGGTASKASFARALCEHCKRHDAMAALIDAVLGSRTEASPQLPKLVEDVLRAPVELKVGDDLDGYKITRKMGAGPNGTVYAARFSGAAPGGAADNGDKTVTLKLLHNAAVHDKSAVFRFLTRNRLCAAIGSDNLPGGLKAGFLDDRPFVAYEAVDGRPLAPRIARTGALHINEARVLLHGVLSALRALHDKKLVHGAVKLENVLVTKNEDGSPRVLLVDAGGDLLDSSWVHSDVASGGGDRIKGLAPEQLKGLGTTAKSDMYAFGALLFEVLTGKPPHDESTATDLAVAHLSKEPPKASDLAPRGWVSDELSNLCAALLSKEPGKRPGIDAVIDVIGPLDKAKDKITAEELTELIDALVADPLDTESAIALELTLERDADGHQVAEAFLMAADMVDLDEAETAALEGEDTGAVAAARAEAARDRALEVKKGLLFRAARLFESKLGEPSRAEDAYKWLLEIAPDDEVAQSGFEAALKAQDKLEELIERLLGVGESHPSHSERARAFNKIGQLYASSLDDIDQAIFAYAQALAQDVQNEDYATDLERTAGDNMQLWAEAMRILHEVSEHPNMPQETRIALFMRLGTWYSVKIQRADLAIPCFDAVNRMDPSHDGALQGMTDVFRRAQLWNELSAVLLSRVETAATPSRARDLRAEAAEILETRLKDDARARDLYEETLKEDPGHEKTVEALARIYRRDEDHAGYVKILDKQAEALSGTQRAETLCKIGEIYEDDLKDLAEAQRRFEAALEIDPGNMTAVRGLDRMFSRTGRYSELLDNLARQVNLAATPRQKINLYQRIAGIQEEEFLDHGKAADALEKVLELDGAHEGAITSLMRHYRALDRWDEVVELYDRALKVTEEPARRVELLLAQGQVLLDQILSPERARLAYEHVLQVEPENARALESLAHVRAATGDAMAALAAVESLAEKAETPEAQAEQWLRAAKILEDHGDRDGAIVRYQRALDAQPDHGGASDALRKAYLARGDAGSAAELINQELERTDSKLQKARLYQELALLQLERLDDSEAAEKSAAKAIDNDPTNARALLLLGDIAFDHQRYVEASAHFGQLSTRVDALPKDDGRRMLMRYIDSLARSGSTEKASKSVKALLDLAPDDPEALRRCARVRIDCSEAKKEAKKVDAALAEAKGAVELYEQLFDKHPDAFDAEGKGLALLEYGKALRLAGTPERALEPLNEASDLIPGSVEPIDELARVYEAQEQWLEVIRVKQRRLDVAEGAERARLLLEIGEVYAAPLKDATKAAKSFVAALEEKPDDRKVLTRLMKLYSEEKDWGKLVEVVLKLAEGVEEPKQKAKYIHTAAVVSARQIGDLDAAIEYLQQVMELDPENPKALSEAIDVREQKGDFEGVIELCNIQLERAEESGNQAEIVGILDRLATIYEVKLGKIEEAVATLEKAQELDPDNEQRGDTLARLYASDTTMFLDKAVGAQMDILRRDAFNAPVYRALRKLYTDAKQADPAWCICQALHVMNCAEPDEERFFRRMRAETAAEARERVSLEDWATVLTHEQVDGIVTAIFQLIEPAVYKKNARPLEELGYQASYAIDLSVHPYPMSQTLYYAAGVLGMEAPMTFQNPQDPGGVSFLHSQPPCIVLGAAALAAEIPTQAGAFITARHLTYYRPGLYIRHLVPTGTGLRAWLFAAIRLIHDGFPVAAELESTVKENAVSIKGALSGPHRDKLASAVSKLLQGGSIDLKRWVAGVDLSADRAGLLLCHDLEIAVEMIKASDEATAAIPHRDRVRELTLFAVDPKYFKLRRALGIHIDA